MQDYNISERSQNEYESELLLHNLLRIIKSPKPTLHTLILYGLSDWWP